MGYPGADRPLAGVFAVVGLVLLWRKAADPTALVAAFAFLTFPITLTNVTSALPAFWRLPDQVVNWLGGSALVLLLYLFPTGRFVPRRTHWLWAGTVVALGGEIFWPSTAPFHLLLQTVSLGGLAVGVIAVQLYRYMRVSTPVERQQTKWVVVGVSVALSGMLIGTVLTRSFPGPFRGHLQLYLIVFGVFSLSPLLIALSFGVAILRYRLWDIDAIINKALVYGLLTGLLGALYAGLILGLESLAGLFGRRAAHNPSCWSWPRWASLRSSCLCGAISRRSLTAASIASAMMPRRRWRASALPSGRR
jgi:hypothetical protein